MGTCRPPFLTAVFLQLFLLFCCWNYIFVAANVSAAGSGAASAAASAAVLPLALLLLLLHVLRPLLSAAFPAGNSPAIAVAVSDGSSA